MLKRTMNANPIGIVRIVKRRLDTDEITEDREEFNLVTERAIKRIYNHQTIGNNIFISSSQDAPHILDSTVSDVYGIGFVRAGITTPRFTARTDVDPEYVEWEMRFNPPTEGTSRTIWTIGLTNSNSISSGNITTNCYLVLAQSCTQSDNEVLDIFYRVVFNPDFSDGVATFGVTGLAKSAGLGNTSEVPSNITYHMNPAISRRDYYDTHMGTAVNSSSDYIDGFHLPWDVPGSNYTKNFSSTTNYSLFYKRTFNWDIQRKFDNNGYPIIGRIFGAVSINNADRHSIARAKILPDSETNRIQPIHLHSVDANKPFQDVGALSVGQGSILLTGNWNRNLISFPEMYRLNVLDTGNSTTGKYNLMKRTFAGYQDNSYVPRLQGNPLFSSRVREPGAEEFHGVGEYNQSDFYDDHTLVTWDSTGVTLMDHITGEWTDWNETTTPQLTVTSINQCCSSDLSGTGDIWVASPTEGLFRIDVVGNSISKATFLAPIDQDKCYGVYRGKNGTIVALMHGGIVVTSNQGGSWTEYRPDTIPVFNYVGITNNLWDNVAYIKVDPDPNNPDLDVAIVSKAGLIVWWRPNNGGESTAGPTFTTTNVKSPNAYTDQRIDENCQAFGVSETGSLWAWSGPTDSMTVCRGRVLYKHSNQFTNTTVETWSNFNHYNYKNAHFIYDKKGNAFFVNGQYIFDSKGRSLDRSLSYSVYSGSYADDKGSLFFPYSNILFSNRSILSIGTGETTDSKYRDLIWKEYGWHHTNQAWTYDWHGTPPQRLNGYLDMVRHNFDVNSWLFDGTCTGVSIRNAAPYQAAKTPIRTIFMTISSDQIFDGSSKYLLDMNCSQRWWINWMDENSGLADKITIYDEDGNSHTITDRPIDAGKHRLCITISEGNEIAAWWDGNLVLENATLNSFNNEDFLSILLGTSINLDGTNFSNNKFEGQIENVQLLDSPVDQDLVTLDDANFLGNPSYCVSASNTDTLVDTKYFNKTNGSVSYSSYSWTYTGNASGSVKSFWIPEVIGDDKDFDIQFSMDNLSGTGNPTGKWTTVGVANSTSYNQNSYSLFEYGIAFDIEGNEYRLVLQGSLGSSLGTWSDTDTFRILRSGNDVEFYKNAVLVGTDTFTPSNGNTYFSGNWGFGGYGRVTINFAKILRPFFTQNIKGHWLMTEVIADSGLKVMHDIAEPAIDGVVIRFEDNPDPVTQFFKSDYYTWGCCEGFLKDNIRTLGGSYSIYYKPTEFDLTAIEPAIVTGTPIPAVSSKSLGLWDGANLGSELISILGDSGNNKGAYHLNHYMIDTSDLEYLSIKINGIEAVLKDIDNHNYGLPTPQSGQYITFNEERWMQPRNGQAIFLQKNNGNWEQHTVVSNNPSGQSAYTIQVSPSVDAGNPFIAYGHAVEPATNILEGNVAIDPVWGLVRFHINDANKNLQVRYAAIANTD